MIDYITGTVTELNPACAVVECNGIGYDINISLNTFSALEKDASCKILIHEAIRDDAHLLYGFATADERNLFRQLITVSGVGAGTARMMLSSLTPSDLREAIISGNVAILKGVRGIGLKTAQRIIVDLKDKIGKHAGAGEILTFSDNTAREEALSALVMLGFARSSVLKVIDNILRENNKLQVEEIVRKALKLL
ncbi:MAG TPA: Holliday junction branch migration protein RuvA [Bacteroidales bacterium]|jgi:Holliday junction DNA helicase RuvA|nr:Holliday junction branch migration protein RuvA [Bacteroidales bacterium]MDI9533241.1 Holliday junction branch migration protein RuvA [Bacteroidota bacterium]OPZ58098.1 MAG: Holliday junction ATP-dependent DNA helicase RuvA [Bacteroidetes bacterium ADurb.BinA012]MBK7732162.1 Holliday junction branch migration protein RuvA [Bacteroidales bacterium]MBP7035850.1 Holliday junction branch migration protein RuvA [Bacteroidales bacterium]